MSEVKAFSNTLVTKNQSALISAEVTVSMRKPRLEASIHLRSSIMPVKIAATWSGGTPARYSSNPGELTEDVANIVPTLMSAASPPTLAAR